MYIFLNVVVGHCCVKGQTTFALFHIHLHFSRDGTDSDIVYIHFILKAVLHRASQYVSRAQGLNIYSMYRIP